MRIFSLVFFTLLLFSYSSFGQDKPTRDALDALSKNKQNDTARVNRLNDLVLTGDLGAEQLTALAKEALALATRLGYTEGIGYAHLSGAVADLYNGIDPTQHLHKADSIAKQVKQPRLTFFLLNTYSRNYRVSDLRKSLGFLQEAERIAEKEDDPFLLALSQNQMVSVFGTGLGDQVNAMEYSLKAMENAERANSPQLLANAWAQRAAIYSALGEQKKSLECYEKAVTLNKQLGNTTLASNLYNSIGERYRLTGQYEKALAAYQESLIDEDQPYRIELTQSNMADVYLRMNRLDSAFYYAYTSLKSAEDINDTEGVAWIYSILSRAHLARGTTDSALYYAGKGLDISRQVGSLEFKRDNALAMANAYEAISDYRNAYGSYKQHIEFRDSMLNTEITNRSNVLQYNVEMEKKQGEIAALRQKQRLQQTLLGSALAVLILIIVLAVALLRNNRLKQKANNILQKQKKEIELQRDKTNKALAELQSTQTQLVQSEKMASLGELTAGIAHEIQNPLNFVNNFAEVNKELLEELAEAIEQNEDQEAKTLIADIVSNEEKIRNHGQRADGIVKSMLQHSRRSSGQKELTDINQLADEYLRLSYHGLRARDKSFSATFSAELDESIPKLEVFPQELGRVILNLLNNAFYAVAQRAKTEMPEANYKPTVILRTQKLNDEITISISDNGNGVPEDVQQKIFQPFFTTKPTGDGTGLGLSLSYDIMKAHGGDLRFSTREGSGTTFSLTLPEHSKTDQLAIA